MEGGSSVTITIHGLGCNVSAEDIRQALKPDFPDECTLTLSTAESGEKPQNFAETTVPVDIAQNILKYNGMELRGNAMRITKSSSPVALTATDLPSAMEYSAVESASSGVPTSTEPHRSVDSTTNVYIEIDTTTCMSCYEVANIKNAQIVHAIEIQFPADHTRRLRALKGQNNGKWRISTKNPDLYKNIPFLSYKGQNLGSVKVVTEKKVVNSLGETSFVRARDELSSGMRASGAGNPDTELLITLVGADEPRFEHVSDEELVERVVSMGVGKMKIPIRQQTYKGTSEFTGNKYFVLKDLEPGDKKRLHDHFDFFDAVNGRMGRMWLSWYGKQRNCSHCRKTHDGECPLMALAAKLQEERDAIKSKNGNVHPIKTYANSEMRLASQDSMTGDVDCMSGGSTGNILNAIEIDPNPSSIAVVVAGQNELNRTMDVPEFLWQLKKNRERMTKLAENIKLLLLPPPVQNSALPEPKIKEEMFHEHLMRLSLASHNIRVVDNPLECYSDDGGQHPSVEETVALIQYIDEQTKKLFETPYVLPSSTVETLTTTSLYGKVTGLYKYGCSGCDSKERNKWYNLCTECRASLQGDDEVQKMVEEFEERVERFMSVNNPEIQEVSTESPEILSCPHCSTEFDSGEQIRNHFKDRHPEATVPEAAKDLRKKYKYSDERSRRDKAFKPL